MYTNWNGEALPIKSFKTKDHKEIDDISKEWLEDECSRKMPQIKFNEILSTLEKDTKMKILAVRC